MKAPRCGAALGWLLATGALAAGPPPQTAPADAPIAPWVAATAGGDLPQAALLAIGLVPFDPRIEPRRAAEEEVALRRAEARYFPFLLRTVLEQTGNWGPVRMLPVADPYAELTISGEILDASGTRLTLRLKAIDSTGRQWLDRQYRATAGPADYQTPAPTDPFHPLFRQAAADLAQFRASLPLTELERIIETARLQRAAQLAPEVFGDYLSRQTDGSLRINRLPSADDPMLARIERVRASEYLFVDAVDQHFAQYFHDLGPTYTAWRKANLEATTLMDAYRREAASGPTGRREGSAFRRYRELQELKLYQQTLRETLASFAFEIGPTTLDLDGELVELSGSLEDQQRQWQSLLQGIYAAQVGLPADSAAARPGGRRR